MSSLALLARALPDHVHAELLSRLANHLMKGQEIRTRLNEIEGQRICIAAIDSGRSPVFILRNGHLERCAEEAWDVRIAGTLADLLRLASRAEDPDTLFFQRRLTLEGDTETGLLIKNLLDALEFDLDAHFAAVLGARAGRVATSIAERLPRPAIPQRLFRKVLGVHHS